MTIKMLLQITFAATATVTMMTSCSDTATTGTLNADFASTGSSSDTTPSAPVSNDAFKLTVKTSGAPSSYPNSYHLHKFHDTDLDCAIKKGDAKTNMDCLLSVPEQELFLKDLTVTVNVPATMCTFMSQTPYYYFNWAPSVDHTLAGGPDCSTSSAACIESPAKHNSWPVDATYGVPLTQSYAVESSGLNSDFTIKSPVSVLNASVNSGGGGTFRNYNISAANFYGTWATYLASATPAVPTAMTGMQKSYDYLCLDSGGEVQYAIHLYILDWDNLNDYNLYYDSKGVTTSYLKNGTTVTVSPFKGPHDGDYDDTADQCNGDGIYGKCDDYWNWTDLLNLYPQQPTK